MQQQPKKRLLPQYVAFIRSLPSQVFATWCAFASLGCIAICLLFTDYSRLAVLFLIPPLFLAFIGVVGSRSHQRTALVAMTLWLMLCNILFVRLFDLGDQAGQQTRLQQQIVQLENQHNNLQDQQTVLQKQQAFLLLQSADIQNPDLQKQLSADLSATVGDLSLLKVTQPEINGLIDYDISLIQNNDRNLPDASLISTNQKAINDNDSWIQYNPQNAMSQHIRSNNNDLPLSENVPLLARAYQNSCVSGYPCSIHLSWQQPFVNGWQHLTTEPLSATWFFWLSLLLGLSGLFLLLPLNSGPQQVLSYRVAYTGPLANLNDPNFPEQKRQELSAETSLVKIEVRSSFFVNKQEDQGDEAQEFLYLNLGSGTTILDVFLKQNAQPAEEGLSEVYYNKATGNIILKLKPVTPQMVRQAKYARKAKVVGRFPIQIYVVVDYFAGSIAGETPITNVERLQVQEQRGPRWLGGIVTLCRVLIWWVYVFGCYIALMNCSFFFFRSSSIPAQFLYRLGLGLLIAGLVLKGAEFIIIKTTVRRRSYANFTTITNK